MLKNNVASKENDCMIKDLSKIEEKAAICKVSLASGKKEGDSADKQEIERNAVELKAGDDGSIVES